MGSPDEPAEVAGAVTAALSALKEAGEAFRNRESKLVAESRGMPILGSAEVAVRLSEEAAELGRLAQLCGKSAVDLETALGAAFQQMANRVDRPKPKVLEEFMGFTAGWSAGRMATAYELAVEREATWEGPVPPCTVQDGLAVFRAQIAKGVA